MHDEAFADAARPAPRCLLSLPLLPYSIGHEIILLSKRNPIVCLTLEDFAKLPIERAVASVINAADVCSMNWRENHEFFHTFLDKWRIKRQWQRWEKANKHTDWALAIADFRNYRLEGSTCPRITDNRFSESPAEGEGGRSFGSPFLARLIVFLRKSGVANAEVMDYPMGRAAFEYLAAQEDENRVQVENETEAATRIEFDRLANEIKAEHAAKE